MFLITKKIIPVILFFILTAAVTHQAGTDELKIAYVDLIKALNEVEEGREAMAALKKDFGEKQVTLDILQNRLKARRDDFEKKKDQMKPDDRQRSLEDLQREYAELQQTYVQLQKELMESENHITKEIEGKLRVVINDMGERDGYNLILDSSSAVLYYRHHLDVTDQVILEYNRLYGGNQR